MIAYRMRRADTTSEMQLTAPVGSARIESVTYGHDVRVVAHWWCAITAAKESSSMTSKALSSLTSLCPRVELAWSERYHHARPLTAAPQVSPQGLRRMQSEFGQELLGLHTSALEQALTIYLQ